MFTLGATPIIHRSTRPDVPADAYWKAGAGGYVISVVPALDMVIYKMGGNEGQYDPALTRLPVKYTYDGSRANWRPLRSWTHLPKGYGRSQMLPALNAMTT